MATPTRVEIKDDYAIAARCLDPTQAHVLRGCLQAAGIAAAVADDHHSQVDQLISPAMGGARVLVHERDLRAARDVLAAFERGDLALKDWEVPE
jgi:Putative prokaryotic signal transducing protein